jgi:LPXTG-motif cell wall-anchored protein
MPATGGFGDYTFYILAGMFLIGAFIILKKRKDVDL